jgi:histidinol-phosphate aminotransferase
MEAIRRNLADSHRYPDDTNRELAAALAAHLQVAPGQLLLGTGADEVIMLLGQLFLDPGDECLFAFPSFPVYRKAARLMDATPVECPLRDLRIDVDDLLACVTPRTKLVYLCNPNNPTGHLVPGADIRRFLDRLPAHVFPVIDEAYAEFVTDENVTHGVDLFREGRSLAAIRTFSKIYGLAGLRVGYAVLPAELSGIAYHIRNGYNINRLAQHAALAALSDHEHVARTRETVFQGRARLTEGLAALGLEPIPSQTNFVCVEVGCPAEEIYRRMLKRGFIIRPLAGFGLANHIRISVGTPEENDAVLNALADVLTPAAARPPETPR